MSLALNVLRFQLIEVMSAAFATAKENLLPPLTLPLVTIFLKRLIRLRKPIAQGHLPSSVSATSVPRALRKKHIGRRITMNNGFFLGHTSQMESRWFGLDNQPQIGFHFLRAFVNNCYFEYQSKRNFKANFIFQSSFAP